ncbi:Uncharacterized protein AC515_3941 [Pseudomonas savastanoi pv. phaseolicola]|nr:Uncharacterized protein AC515_3941 [Pseudomonas savastanoi pv. phaseolicola]
MPGRGRNASLFAQGSINGANRRLLLKESGSTLANPVSLKP